MIDAYADSINMGPEPDTIGYLLRCGARVEEVQVQMHERMAGVSYLTLGRSMKYMLGDVQFPCLLCNGRAKRSSLKKGRPKVCRLH